MERAVIAKEFHVEEHAALYALLVKAAGTLAPEKAAAATERYTRLYGNERGARMALRAKRDGAPLTTKSYLTYGEWVDASGTQKSRIAALAPEYTTDCLVCPWCNAWNKLGLIEWGKNYCKWVDKSLVEGFNPANTLVIESLLSAGDDCCHFIWKDTAFSSPEELAELMARKKALAPTTLRDFLYHSGHLLSAATRAFAEILGEETTAAVRAKALADFEALYGTEKRAALEAEAELDYSVIDD